MESKKIRIVFMGTPGFAVASLQALIEGGYNVVGVVTAPDKPAGRGQKITASAVKLYAQEKGISILQPEKLKAPEFIDELQNLKADLQVVVAFRMLPEIVWNMPPLGTFNLHASLLPLYRGAAPINWAIINGETQSGVTTFKLQHEIDTGNIIFQEKVNIDPDDNVEILHDKLMAIGAQLVTKTVDALATENIQFISQDELIAKGFETKHAPKIFKDDCKINWNNNGENIRNLIRGLSPYPAAWTNLIANNEKQTPLKIFRADFEAASYAVEPGSIYSDGKTFLKIGANNGWLSIKELQLSGKKRMNTDEFLRGFQQAEKHKAE
jgi:methionyl-tRNA formyltransferase